MFTTAHIIGISLAIYFLPFIVASIRGHHNQVAILILNFFLGWTGLGWIASLVWSATSVAAPAR